MVERMGNTLCGLGEGPLWHGGVLYYLDITGRILHLYNPVSAEEKYYQLSQMTGFLSFSDSGKILLGQQNRIVRFNPPREEVPLVFMEDSPRSIRCNDGKAGPSGELFLGTLDVDLKEGQGFLYRLDLEGKRHTLLKGITIPNGMEWSFDGTFFYFILSKTRELCRWRLAEGHLWDKKVIRAFKEEEGTPDGMTMDSEEMLWIAMWGAGKVIRLDPETGLIDREVLVPAPLTSSCTFGGENLDTLFITTARNWLSPEQLKAYPQSGGLFAFKPGVQGIPARACKGSWDG